MSNPDNSSPTSSSSPQSVTTTDSPVPSHSDDYTTPASSDNTTTSSSGIANYYFVFIALALVIVFLATWLLLRRRRRARVHAMTTQRSALSQDLAETGAARGWTYGGRDGFRLRTLMRRDGQGGEDREGLDERGEAPPPYKPRDEEEGSGDPAGEARPVDEDASSVIAVPMRTVGREDVGLKPPDYSEAVARETAVEGEQQDTAGRGSSASAASATPSRTDRRA